MASVSPHCYFDNHPAMKLVFGSGVHVVSRSLLLLSGWCLFIFGVCWWEGSLAIEGGHAGLLSDYFLFGLVFVSVAALMMTVRLTKSINRVCEQLPRLLKRPAAQQQLAQDIQALRDLVALRTSSSRLYYHTLLVVMLCFVGVFQVLIPLKYPLAVLSWALWPAKYPFSFAAAIPWSVYRNVLILGNVIWISASATLQLVTLVNRYARRDELATVPLAPDGCGGTSCMGQFALANAMLAGCGMIQVVIWLIVFGINAALVIGFVLYILFLTGIFLLPSLGMHRVMVVAKQRELTRLSTIAQRYQSPQPPLEEFVTSEADAAWWQEIGTKVQFQSDLERLYDRARDMPEWPFDSLTVGRFFTLIVVPIVLFIIQSLAQEPLVRLADGLIK